MAPKLKETQLTIPSIGVDVPALQGQVVVSKTYTNLKAAHRQWRHPGHCKFVHGENWSFSISFAADRRDECGFVVDFGALRAFKAKLDHWFDHTLLIDYDDPSLAEFVAMDKKGLTDLRIVRSCSAEGLASFVMELANDEVAKTKDFVARGVRVVFVTCLEDGKNSATIGLPQT